MTGVLVEYGLHEKGDVRCEYTSQYSYSSQKNGVHFIPGIQEYEYHQGLARGPREPRLMKFFFLLFALLLVDQSLLHADVVFLRNGARVEGRIVAQNRTTIRIETAAGIRVLARDSVRRIVYSAFDAAAARRTAEEQRT